MAQIAILGFGVVGGGIAYILDSNKDKISMSAGEEVSVKYILDLREFPDSPYGNRVVHDIAAILEDESVTVVCEAMGGCHPALEYSLQAMKAGKSVVTSNKEVVAKHGDELLACAKENGVSYLYEAAVGGGIPVLRPMKTSLASDKINKITGILNGTTNYILTKMKNDGESFSDALKQAQALGYAEANPTADVDGFDAQRKTIILTAIATGKLLPEEAVYTETMASLTPEDMKAADRLDSAVKLLGCFVAGDKPCAYVAPFIVPDSCPLSHIDDVYNGVWVEGEMTGDVMFYGRGAGRFPTASAMVSDVCAVASGVAKAEVPQVFDRITTDEAVDFETVAFKYYIRIRTNAVEDTREFFESSLGDIKVMDGSENGVVEFVTAEKTKNELSSVLGAYEKAFGVSAEAVIRILK